MFRMPLIALLTLCVLPAAAQQSGSTKCQGPSHVVLEPGISVDVANCDSAPNIAGRQERVDADQRHKEYTPGTVLPRTDVKTFTRTAYNIGGSKDGSSVYVFVYAPDGNWPIVAMSLNVVGEGIIAAGDPLTAGDSTGWVVKQDSRLNHQGKDWLPARQIVQEKGNNNSLRVYFRIIIDTQHNKFYYLYQRTEGCAKTESVCGLDQANRFFNSFTVDSDSRP